MMKLEEVVEEWFKVQEKEKIKGERLESLKKDIQFLLT